MDLFSSLFVFLKSIFPALMGSALAVWYKAKEKDFKRIPKGEFTKFSMYVLCYIVVGAFIGKWLGAFIADHLGVLATVPSFTIIELLSALFGIKLLDGLVKNSDKIIETVIGGIVSKIENIFKG